jgi:hypothetical protein
VADKKDKFREYLIAEYGIGRKRAAKKKAGEKAPKAEKPAKKERPKPPGMRPLKPSGKTAQRKRVKAKMQENNEKREKGK